MTYLFHTNSVVLRLRSGAGNRFLPVASSWALVAIAAFFILANVITRLRRDGFHDRLDDFAAC